MTHSYHPLGSRHTSSGSIINYVFAKPKGPFYNINDPGASEKFQEVQAAYEILSDPDSRAAYDAGGMDGLRGGAGTGDMEDIFAQFFGGGGAGGFSFGFDLGGGGRARTKGADSVHHYQVTLEDLYNGKSVKLNMEKDVVCDVCKGTGARGKGKPKACSTCEGKGWTFATSHISPSHLGTTRVKCSDCDGVGEKLKEKDRCKKCKGEKTVSQKTRQEIFIEKGMADRQRIVLTGAGDEEPGLPAGDVVFILDMTHHESFERSGNDLLTHVKITLSEALLGFSRILVTHLDGRGIKVSSPPGKIMSPDNTIVLRGEGMPIHKHPDQKGDLYVILEIEMPDSQWLKSVDQQALLNLLPPKKADMEPQPEIVDEASFEESDIVDFGNDEDDWEDEDDDEAGEPECRPQ
ncbi:hypothetical protein VKT23_011221 [Stygiomarasmius scandens]|uniref:DnaJ-domain-containing protein n=1 Tax=Marasmiellus scandens TaxID=2682957 RepID=A0ABR1JEG4_9AGAR